MRSARLLALAVTTAALTACGTPTVTSTPDADTAAEEAAISKPSEGESSAGSTKPKPAGIGDAITLTGSDEGLKIAVSVVKVIKNGKAPNEIQNAQAGKRLYGVELVLKNVGTATYDDSPSNGAKVIDSEGQEHDPSLFGEIAGTTQLKSTTIAPGDKRRGVLVFEVPAKAKIERLQFALNSGFADQKGVWAVG
ncbi:DUF4352 domain-containing protein [Streptosporangium sp. NPDC051023]|uniref:DUF4352 domain-containing protein n=1 Tax=Streptosporangium sp. NPDC051023 TaxID=3155410 RepID=UPI00344B92BB